MTIEVSIVRGILTLILMLTFITLVVWLYSKRHKNAYDYAARLPLEDDAPTAANPPSSGSQQS
jgi:cytochrome c oxidase cbb3-type subunit IV